MMARLNDCEIMGLVLLHHFFTSPLSMSEDVFKSIFVFSCEYSHSDLQSAVPHSDPELEAQMFLQRITRVFVEKNFCCCLEVLLETFGLKLFFKYVPVAAMIDCAEHPYWIRLITLPYSDLALLKSSALLHKNSWMLDRLSDISLSTAEDHEDAAYQVN